ncbi:MAG: hypothetical protein FJ244_08940 [Nitrospira sp.]|nr:hypothetical protein [Nitrospira sp.]
MGLRWYNWIGLVMLMIAGLIFELVFLAADTSFSVLWLITAAWAITGVILVLWEGKEEAEA